MRGNLRAGTFWKLGAVCVTALGLTAGAARAQAPAPRGQKIFTKKTSLELPIQIDDAHRPQVHEVVLHVKQGNGPWARVESAPPARRAFLYQVPQDGEYWFNVVTVGRNGVAAPADLNAVPPGLMVVVDTLAPAVEVHGAAYGGEVALRCVVQDANPDPAGVKASYRGPDGQPRYLDAVPGQPLLFRVPSPEVLNGAVKVTVADRAGNLTVRDVNVREVLAQRPAAPAVPAPPVAPPAPVVPAVALQPATPPAPAAPPAPPAPPAQAPQGFPMPPAPAPVTQANHLSPPSDSVAPSAPSGHRLIASRQASIEYRLDPIGPSGVSKIEVWATSDRGATWQRLGEDADKRSPAEVILPGDGVYGIRLSVTNGNGFGGAPPVPGDAPTSWVEVDTTPPVAQLRDINPVTTGGVLEIRWNASDRNLGPEPVQLSYATKREGPWQPVAKSLKNDGAYRWAFPREAGGQFFLRLEVTDLAGNTTRCDTPTPISLDVTEPRATVVGITAVAPAATPPGPPSGN